MLGQRLLLAGVERAAAVAVERLPQRPRGLARRHLVVYQEPQARRIQPQPLAPRVRNIVRQRRACQKRDCRRPLQKATLPVTTASGLEPPEGKSMAPGS